ncbi:unnamed protein product [Durusdinium trenchii]|uniref:Uncharacterized protein n=1 Tax=Durusdinium trenchii TaxID=1381693 RepID=A0ABP0J2I8_9DINO
MCSEPRFCRSSFRSCFILAGPCYLVAVAASSILYENTTQLNGKGPMARHALQLQELIFTPSSDSDSLDSSTSDQPEARVSLDADTTTSETGDQSRPSPGSQHQFGRPGIASWWNSSYFDTVAREERLLCPASAEVSTWNGRLGNHIHQILNLLLFAHLCHVSDVRFPKHQDNMHAYSHQIGLLDMPTKLKFPHQDPKLKHLLKCPRHANHRHPWFGNYCATNTPMWVYHQLALEFVRPRLGELIQKCLQRPEDSDADRTLTVHMRADDIQKYPDYSWGQPPCSMYEKIIEENKNNFTKILLIQKGNAPCSQRLLDAAKKAMMLVQYPDNKFDETSVPWHLRIFHREARLVATMSDMLSNLVHLVLSFSTFAVSAALLSTSMKTLYRRREAAWESYLKSPGLNCNTWPGVTMYDYSFNVLEA